MSSAEPPTATAGVESGTEENTSFGRTVVLPPYAVSAMRIDKHPWRYTSLPGLEILTRASDDDTRHLLVAYLRSWWIENKVFPPNWLQGPAVPYTVIIDDTDPKTVRRAEEAMAPLMDDSATDLLGWDLHGWPFSPIAEKVAPEKGWIRTGDKDTTALAANLHNGTIFVHIPTGLDRVDRSVPPLPPWLMAGLLERFGVFEMRTHIVVIISKDLGVDSAVVFRGARWISTEETKRLKKEIASKRHQLNIPFIPLAQFFAEPPPRGERRLLWESEAGLFVRWGLFGRSGFFDPVATRAGRRESFLEFVQRARHEPVTENMFMECFGCGFSAMERILTDYLKKTIAQSTKVDLNLPAYFIFPKKFQEPELKPATPDQIGRILGDWLRMQGQSIRQEQPVMSAKFLDAAGRMLTRAYKLDNGLPPDVDPAPQEVRNSQPIPQNASEPLVRLKPFVVSAERIHDAGLLAVFGLYEHDIGDDEKARVYLDKAAKSGVIRPTAYLVLAQLREAEAIAKPLGRGGKLSAAQVSFILEPVKVALRSSATAEAWDLTVQTLARCEVKPTSADIKGIVEGVSQFPRDTSLALRTARLCVQTGQLKHATALIDKSMPFALDEDTRQTFQTLRASLSVGADLR